MIFNCNDICKSFDGKTILSHCSFHVEENEKCAIIGINGAGKSTLLKIILGELPADTGNVIFSKNTTVGYLAQNANVDSNNTIYNELLSVKQDLYDAELHLRALEGQMQTASEAEMVSLVEQYSKESDEFEHNGGYLYKSQLIGVLKGLGFDEDDYHKSISTLSGGQKTRVALGKLLLTQPDIIFLDEPTNHLDMDSIKWLETYLLNYRGSVVIISHDRYFLDKIVTKVVEIENCELTCYSGNYTDFATKKAIVRNMKLKEYMNQQREIKHQEEVITKLKQFNREKSIKRAESRQKMLDKIEVIDKPTDINDKMHLTLEPEIISGNDVLSVLELSKSYDIELFNNISFEIKRQEKVALIGKNGTGKTTILKILNGLVLADNGTFKLGSNVTIGYYDQEHHVLDESKTLFDEIHDAYPDLNNTKIRNTLAAFLFTNDDVFKRVGELSGGEKGRLSLAKLMLSNANFLILDEPTNHLDVTSREILENAINSYTGTVLYVSHDRYFINQTATRIIELTHNKIFNYDGNYNYYLDKHDIVMANEIEIATASINSTASESKVKYKESREEQARLRKLKNKLQSLEKEIAELEDKIADVDTLLANPEIASNAGRLMELHNEKSEYESRLESLYSDWEEVSLEMEQ